MNQQEIYEDMECRLWSCIATSALAVQMNPKNADKITKECRAKVLNIITETYDKYGVKYRFDGFANLSKNIVFVRKTIHFL